MSVVVVGSINVDLQLRLARHPLPGETLLASGGDRSPGGKGANQACAAALAGAQTTMLGAVGADGTASVALGLLNAAGVDLTHVVEVSGPTGLAVVSVDAAGENTVVVVPGANALVSPRIVDSWAAIIAPGQVLVLQGEIPAESSAVAAHLCQGRVLLNLAPAIDVDPSLLRQADPLVVNEHEGVAALLLLDADESERAPMDVVVKLRDHGVPSVVMTLGPAGCIVAAGTDSVCVAAPKVRAVDTVGAGDAFVGALAARLAAGHGLAEAARYATSFAAYTVQFDGAQSSYPPRGAKLPGVE